ncbi:MAG TPA: shikimate dehydrogenase [Gemmataceae bacterium]|nr:shikimate dehydrogenase [Gemmataceae bacterium]
MPSATEPICVVIGRTRHKMVQIEIQEAAKRGAQMIELRLDFLAKAPDFKRLLANKPCALVATVRRPQDGGRWPGSEEERRMLLRQAIVGGFDWVDVETDIAEQIRRFKDVKRIVSYHNLREVPADLEKIHERMCQQDPDVVKLAITAQHPVDNLRVLKLVKNASRPTVAFCMGDLGIPSRILGARFGAPFTYAAFNKERGIAPGILSYEELKRIYHYGRINKETKSFGVLGDPVAHSLSPLIHNAAFAALGINGIYVPFRVPRGGLEDFLKQFDQLPVYGYSVTIPHKEAAANLAHEKGEAVDLIHAANTLVRGEAGFIAYNTDFQAIRDSLLANLSADGLPASLHSRTVLILGAGGVARAVAHALQRAGAAVAIANRTYDRAVKLAEEVDCRAVDWAARHNVVCDTLINCTSVGMHPNVDESPIHPSFLKPGLVVMDIVYTPETTLLVKEARSRGCRVLTGVDMFVRQAALQFELFTGEQAPLELMRRVVKRALSPVALRDEEDV